jgi:hypothetical protein
LRDSGESTPAIEREEFGVGEVDEYGDDENKDEEKRRRIGVLGPERRRGWACPDVGANGDREGDTASEVSDEGVFKNNDKARGRRDEVRAGTLDVVKGSSSCVKEE